VVQPRKHVKTCLRGTKEPMIELSHKPIEPRSALQMESLSTWDACTSCRRGLVVFGRVFSALCSSQSALIPTEAVAGSTFWPSQKSDDQPLAFISIKAEKTPLSSGSCRVKEDSCSTQTWQLNLPRIPNFRRVWGGGIVGNQRSEIFTCLGKQDTPLLSGNVKGSSYYARKSEADCLRVRKSTGVDKGYLRLPELNHKQKHLEN
jgi:hypothetical protein